MTSTFRKYIIEGYRGESWNKSVKNFLDDDGVVLVK